MGGMLRTIFGLRGGFSIVMGPAAICAILLAGCVGGCAAPKSGRISIDHRTPQTLMTGFCKALAARDYPALLDAGDPNERDNLAVLLRLTGALEALRHRDDPNATGRGGDSFLTRLSSALCSKELVFTHVGEDSWQVRAAGERESAKRSLNLIRREGKYYVRFPRERPVWPGPLNLEVLAAKGDYDALVSVNEQARVGPYANLDYYVDCLWPAEKKAFFESLRSNGFRKTILKVKLPASWWYAQINACGAQTPFGFMSFEDYDKYRDKLSAVTGAIERQAAWGWPCGRTASPEAKAESPFAVFDRYLTFLSKTDDSDLFLSLRKWGFQFTLSRLEMPASWRHGETTSDGLFVTPRGPMTKAQYGKYDRRRKAAFRALKGLVNGAGGKLTTQPPQPRSRPKTNRKGGLVSC